MAVIAGIKAVQHWNLTLSDDDAGTTDVRTTGIITDLDLPELTSDFDTDIRAGELGVVARPKRMEELELSFTAVYPSNELMAAVARSKTIPVKLTATVCVENDGVSPVAYIVEGRGYNAAMPLGGLSADGIEMEYTFMLYYLSVTMGTFSMIYNPREYIFSINGTNMYAAVKTIIDPPAV